jgi:hypothetical protein
MRELWQNEGAPDSYRDRFALIFLLLFLSRKKSKKGTFKTKKVTIRNNWQTPNPLHLTRHRIHHEQTFFRRKGNTATRNIY